MSVTISGVPADSYRRMLGEKYKPRVRLRKCKRCSKPFVCGTGFFLTDTCNPCFKEIVETLYGHQS
jgi:hypothetical protein